MKLNLHFLTMSKEKEERRRKKRNRRRLFVNEQVLTKCKCVRVCFVKIPINYRTKSLRVLIHRIKKKRMTWWDTESDNERMKETHRHAFIQNESREERREEKKILTVSCTLYASTHAMRRYDLNWKYCYLLMQSIYSYRFFHLSMKIRVLYVVLTAPLEAYRAPSFSSTFN